MTTKRRAKTTPSRPRKETVAEPQEEAVEPVETASAPTPAAVVDKGMCDNHPDRPAVFVTDFAWAQPQRFCARCVPSQYRPLMQ